MRPKTVKAFRQGDSTVMTIPAPMAEELGIGAGDYLTVWLEKNGLKVVRALPVEAESLEIVFGVRSRKQKSEAV